MTARWECFRPCVVSLPDMKACTFFPEARNGLHRPALNDYAKGPLLAARGYLSYPCLTWDGFFQLVHAKEFMVVRMFLSLLAAFKNRNGSS